MNTDVDFPPSLRDLSLKEASEAQWQHLSQSWPTAAMVDRQMGLNPEDTVQPCLVATQLRLEGKILGVYLPPTDAWAAHYRYPTWQFDKEGNPISQMQDVLATLRTQGDFLNEKGCTSGWGEVAWFMGEHALLDGETPAQMLTIDPNRVVEAARAEFSGPRDSNF